MPRKNRKGLPSSLALAALFFAASGAAQATMINARSPSLTDVRTAIASAADGDTVIVPAGTAVWRDALTITKGITLQGQTTTEMKPMARMEGKPFYWTATPDADQAVVHS